MISRFWKAPCAVARSYGNPQIGYVFECACNEFTASDEDLDTAARRMAEHTGERYSPVTLEPVS